MYFYMYKINVELEQATNLHRAIPPEKVRKKMQF